MRHPNLLPLIYGLWIAFLAIWLLAATKTKRVARRASASSLAVQIGLTAPAGLLMFDRALSVGFLEFRFLPDFAALAYLGVAVTAIGIAFAVWARFVLGQNWSSQVTLKQGHELIRGGPMRWFAIPFIRACFWVYWAPPSAWANSGD